MDNIPLFGDRKKGRVSIAYPHPLLEPILKETYGIFVYQEQVMEAAQVLAGYSLGRRDLLRRAMGKKIKSEMDAQRRAFSSEGWGRPTIFRQPKAKELFDLIDKFAGYGFNKSHAASLVPVRLSHAWAKSASSSRVFAASMSFDMAQTDKLSLFRRGQSPERRRVPSRPTSMRREADFSWTRPRSRMRSALKGRWREGEWKRLEADAKANGPYQSLDDFAERIDPKLLNRRQLESLAAAGAFDSINPDRPALHAAAETILAHASAAHEQRTSGQHGLFGGGGASSGGRAYSPAEGRPLDPGRAHGR
jgi:DNA polymerase-3 subunit alpha